MLLVFFFLGGGVGWGGIFVGDCSLLQRLRQQTRSKLSTVIKSYIKLSFRNRYKVFKKIKR